MCMNTDRGLYLRGGPIVPLKLVFKRWRRFAKLSDCSVPSIALIDNANDPFGTLYLNRIFKQYTTDSSGPLQIDARPRDEDILMPDSSPNPAMDAICGLKCANMESCSECRELKQLEAEIVNATRRRARFLVKANERRDTLTSTLPVEVICSIFEAYLDIHRIDTTDQSFQSHQCQARPRLFPVSAHRVPLLLGTVCHRWRQLAWSHPQLWSTILIDLACPANVLGPELVSEWSKRSGNLPLNIRVDDDETQCYHPPGIIDHGKQVMRVLNEHSARWSSIDVSGVALEILAELDDSACLEASVLKHFSFGGHWNDAHPDEPQKTILRTTKRQHRPTHLALLQEMPPSLVKVDWSWVTHLYVTNMSQICPGNVPSKQ
ncbi:hypothetical protein D9619_012313 [Psilocybe cf. subviscida]|uniref:F-box domain-containing protein n=1 Tax=Psilocybe cf. subviscida TaxID=2480587 RepID=A0A8H5AR43_9AGAR|nr:hypothetical protein D9619_012313 [Psilocybe cf. subviscida]